MVNEHFLNDIHNFNPISPERLEFGEIKISIASMMMALHVHAFQ